MNLKCPNCGGSVVLNPETGKMECIQCKGAVKAGFSIKKNDLDISDSLLDEKTALEFAKMSRAEKYIAESGNFIDAPINMGVGGYEEYLQDKGIVEEDIDGDVDAGYMKMNVYKCTSCGAKLMVNRNETSSFCAYCGQPTIIFDRVSKELQPDVVIPFTITKDKAINLIKEKLNKGRFVPDEIKNFEIDKIRGIYIPFWLVSTKNRCKMNLLATNSEKRNGRTYTKTIKVYRDVECDYDRITVDASRKLDDIISKRLEPYDTSKSVPFDIGYMSGFYADKYDVAADEAVRIADKRSEEFIENQIISSCEYLGSITKKSSDHKTKEMDVEYAMLPAWFMTYRYKGIIYTIVVNGQTGKVVGNIPVKKSKVAFALSIFTMLITTLSVYLAVFGGNIIYHELLYAKNIDANGSEIGFFIVGGLVLFSLYQFTTGIMKAKRYKQEGTKFSGNVTVKYVKKRQDKTWVR